MPLKILPFYFLPRIASLAALATRNFTTRLALIWMVSPVAGLRPTRALRLTSTSLPRPGMVNSRDDVSDYCAKYVTKEGAWWGIKLVGHRHPAFKEFKLVME